MIHSDLVNPVPRQKKILLIGDLIFDITYFVDVEKISPEAPIPVAYLTHEDPVVTPGGAGLAATYLHKHGYSYQFITDSIDCNVKSLDTLNINIANSLKSVHKIRYIDRKFNYQLIRIDTDKLNMNYQTFGMDINAADKLSEIMSDKICVIACLDYQKGVFSEAVIHYILEFAQRNNITTYVDTRGDSNSFRGFNIVKLNQKEFERAKELTADLLLVTKGKNGVDMYDHYDNGQYRSAFTHQPEIKDVIPDVTGCGDVFDMEFCYNRFVLGHSAITSMKNASNKATEFAYQSPRTRLALD